jgi:glyoxylase-like metal-dependent hydrolase (beta-lactamase superfamily II)
MYVKRLSDIDEKMLERLIALARCISLTVIATALMLVEAFLSTSDAANADDKTYIPNEVFRSADGDTSVESLGKGVFLFRWHPGLYVSPFLVGDDEVVAVDPVNRDVARLYRDAIASVTGNPVTKIIYSHEHLDHIKGAAVLGPGASRFAHPNTAKWLEAYHASVVPLPTHTIDDGDHVAVGERVIGVHYFGPNHGDGNIALSFDTDDGMLLVFVDTIEVGIVPYRSLPDTNFNGYLRSLEAAAALQPDWVLGGHSGPGPGIWLTNFLNYFVDMKASLAKSNEEIGSLSIAAGESFIVASERHTGQIIERAVELMRPQYGHWYGFEEWAPMNAQTVQMAILVGK